MSQSVAGVSQSVARVSQECRKSVTECRKSVAECHKVSNWCLRVSPARQRVDTVTDTGRAGGWYVEEGGSGLFPERGQISREISGILFSSEGSDFQENF